MQSSSVALLVDPLARAPHDAEGMLAYVDRHRLAGFAARAWQGAARPGGLTPELATRQRRAAHSALRHASATVRAIEALQARGIEAVPLKGAVLADHLYGDPAIRDVRDADLLIRPDDLAEANCVLLECGYARTWPWRLPLRGTRAHQRLLERGYHFEYRHVEEQVNLEIHWRFPDWSSGAVEAVWEATERRMWRGSELRLLADDALLLLFLCDHGARHRWFLLKWLVDVATLLPRVEDAGRLVEMARRFDLERPLGQAVALCRRMFGTNTGSELGALAERRDCQRLAGEALAFLNAPARDYFTAGRTLRGKLRERLYRRRLRMRPERWL